jgi:carbonic anhydrase
LKTCPHRTLAASLGAALILGFAPLSLRAADPPPSAASVTPTTALRRLLSGNRRFAEGKPDHQNQDGARRAQVANGQAPFAVVLSCSDSRVPPEVVFDQGLGDLFIVRTAGNIAGTNELGSIQYAAEHLGPRLIVVLGHEKCGAVEAAMLTEDEVKDEPQELREVLTTIRPGIAAVPQEGDKDGRLSKCVEANVRANIQKLNASPGMAALIQKNAIEVVGAVYDLKSGQVRIVSSK